jgi:hypothetical protein
MILQDLIQDALTVCGRLGAGRKAGQSESDVALYIVNRLLDSWSVKRLTVYAVALNTYALVAATESYTIGIGGVFNAPRPIVLESANIVASIESSTAHFPLQIIGQIEYAALETYADQSIIPKKLYIDGAFPLSTIYLYPIPATNTHLDLYTWQPLTQFAPPAGTVSTVGTAVTFVTGAQFSTEWVSTNNPPWLAPSITINGVAYTIASVQSATALTLTATAGAQTDVAYSASVFLAAVSFPPGYGRALTDNLAVELAPSFALKVTAELASIATASKEAIESVNARMVPQPEIAAQGAAETQQGNKQ